MTAPQKHCTGCKEDKCTTDFYVNRSSRDGLTSYCKRCCSNRSTTWARNNATKVAKAKQLSRYSITHELYEDLLQAQGGGCALCKRKENSGISFCVDHDHSCCPGGKSCGMCVRGLLCSSCNRALGKFGDDANGILNLLEYIDRRPFAKSRRAGGMRNDCAAAG